MFRIDSSGAVTSIPTPAAPGSTSGYFTGGNPALGQVATRLTADWFNAVQEELMAVLTAASVTPSKTNQAQLLAALQALFNVKLGFTPVQQGTGVGQLSNLVKLGWSAGSKLKAT